MRIAALPLVVALATAVPVGAQSTGGPYLLLGIDAYRSGDVATAAHFLSIALELDPESGDCLYYSARLSAATDLSRSITLLERALRAGRFEQVRPVSARLDLASDEVRVGRYEDALAQIDALGPPDEDRVEPFRLAAAAELGLGRGEAALSFIEAGLRHHPLDARLQILRAQALRAGGFPIKQVLDLAAVVAPDDTAVAAQRALAEISEGGFKPAEYESAGKGDPRVFAAAFLKTPDADLLRRFFASGGNQHVDLLARVQRVARQTPELERAFTDDTRGYSGKRWVDANWDSYPEEIYEYKDGTLVSWVLDSNQDLVPEARYDRAKDSVTVGPVVYTFSPYPFLIRVDEMKAPQWSFDLPPRRMRGPFLEGLQEPGVARIRLAADLPAEGTLAMAARAVTSTDLSGLRRTWTLEAGVPVSLEEIPVGAPEGRPDYVLAFREGRPLVGRRDLDGDGLFDVTERWSSGRISRLEVDLNHDGIPEYVVDFLRHLSLWDTNEDGTPEQTGPSGDAGRSPDVWPAVIPMTVIPMKGESR